MASHRNKSFKRSIRRWAFLAVAVVALVLVLTASYYYTSKSKGGDGSFGPTCVAKQGPMTITVTESGTIQSRDQAVVKDRVPGTKTIIYLVPEGTHVKKGDLLIQLDSSDLEDSQSNQEITVENAQADLTNAKENLTITKSQAQSDVSNAKLAAQFAKADLEKYIKGEYPQQLQQDQANITLAKQKLEQARTTLEGSEKLYKLNYISKTERDSDALAEKQAELNEKMAEGDLKLLQDYTYPRQIEQLKSNVTQTAMALDRVKLSSRANIVQAESTYRWRQSSYSRVKRHLDDLNEWIKNCNIYAPRSGMVIYASTGGRHAWANQQPLAEGQDVHDRQELIDLPTPGSMTAEIKVHESSVDKVQPGQPVLLKVDAYPGETFTGTVAKIAPLPDAQSVWLNPDLKVYDTTINIQGDHDQLRTGMSCEAKIIVDQYDNATYVPIQSVIRVGDQPTVFAVHNGRSIPVPVKLGLDNNRTVRILSGIAPGQRVLLAPPLAAGQAASPIAPKGKPELAMKSSKSGASSDQHAATAPTPAQLLKQAEANGYKPPTKKTIREKHADLQTAQPHPHHRRQRHKSKTSGNDVEANSATQPSQDRG